jgi:hypothetical protein
MYVFFNPADGSILYTASGNKSLVEGQDDWIEVAEQNLGDLSAWSVVNGDLVLTDIAPMISAAVTRFNAAVGQVRSRFITPIPGQEMIYLRKEQEAAAYVADTSPLMANYPMIANEIGITGGDAYQVAQTWLNMAGLWMTVAIILEQIRLGHIAQVSACVTATEVAAVQTSFDQSIATFLAQL